MGKIKYEIPPVLTNRVLIHLKNIMPNSIMFKKMFCSFAGVEQIVFKLIVVGGKTNL